MLDGRHGDALFPVNAASRITLCCSRVEMAFSRNQFAFCVHPRGGAACGVRCQSHVTALLNAGLLSKTDDGMIVFPYDAIHVDFMLKAA